MSTLNESFSIPVDTVFEEEHSRPGRLQSRVLKIIEQKGHFRHVTERSLLAADDSGSDENDDSRLQNEDSDEKETPEDRDVRLAKGKDDMLQQLSRAQNDTLAALELVSFLLSKHSNLAQSSLSEEIKGRVPMGTLDAKVVQARGVPDPKVKQLTLNSQGWRSQKFGSVSQTLAVASTRLRKESERECKYWEQMAKLRENGTAISRYPRDTSAVAVHYGSANAAPQFQSRGFALLRQDTDSSMYIDRGAVPHRRKRIQVEIHRGSQRSGCYKFNAGSTYDTTEVAQAIATARDELLEEELFHEIGREARIFANQGITARGQTITANIENEYEVLISLKVPLLDSGSSNPEDNFLAEYIGLSLRALLQQAHNDTYICRSRTPPPLLARPNPPIEHAILRPLISKLKHCVAVEQLQSSVDKQIIQPARRAGLEINWQHATTESPEVGLDDGQREFIMSKQPRRSVFDLALPSDRQIYVTITSHLGSPIYGNKYEISGLDDELAPMKPASYQTLDTTLEALLELLKLDLVVFVASIEVPNHSDKNQDKTKGLRWKVTRPHHGELTLPSTRSPRLAARMRVETVNSNLVIRLAPAAPEYQKGKKILAWTWGRRELSNGAVVTGNPEDVNIDEAVAENLTLGEVVEKSLSLATSHT